MADLQQMLNEFANSQEVFEKGKLAAALVLTHQASLKGGPWDTKDFITKSQGQVKGLSSSAVQKILKEHGIVRILASQGGRTSRGNMSLMHAYIAFLNDLFALGILDFGQIEHFWVQKIRDYFDSQPFHLQVDQTKSVRHLVKGLLSEAIKRQSECGGTTVVGTVMEHLVGAKIDAMLGIDVQHKSASAADASTGGKGDFLIGDTVVHVTNHPSEDLIRKCSQNLAQNLRPLIVTNQKGVPVADGLAEAEGIEERIDVLEIGQFMATNIYEKSKFLQKQRATTLGDIVTIYNEIIEKCETDPSLKIEID